MNATCVPSGEMTGAVMPRTGCALRESKSRTAALYGVRVNEMDGGELDRHGVAAGNAARLDLAVGRIEDLGRRNPLRAKREHVLVARDLPAIEHQVAAIVGDDVVDHPRAVGLHDGALTAPAAGAIDGSLPSRRSTAQMPRRSSRSLTNAIVALTGEYAGA